MCFKDSPNSIITNNPLLCVIVESLVHSIRKNSIMRIVIAKYFRFIFSLNILEAFNAIVPQNKKNRAAPTTPNCANAG